MFRKKKKKRPEISAPQNFQHRVHTSFDPKEGKFVGLPPQWQNILDTLRRPKPVVDPSRITRVQLQPMKVRGRVSSHVWPLPRHRKPSVKPQRHPEGPLGYQNQARLSLLPPQPPTDQPFCMGRILSQAWQLLTISPGLDRLRQSYCNVLEASLSCLEKNKTKPQTHQN